jgi:nitroreductase
MPNPVFDTERTLLAVREYRDEPIPDDVLDRIVQSAHLNASSMNRQPWHFVVVRGRDELRELASLLRTGPYTAGAAAAVVVAAERDSPFGVSDTSRAIQSMMITAWAEGVGSNWVGFAGRYGETIAPLLGIPDDHEILAVVPFGYPVASLGKGIKKRKALAEVAHSEKFGQPFA